MGNRSLCLHARAIADQKVLPMGDIAGNQHSRVLCADAGGRFAHIITRQNCRDRGTPALSYAARARRSIGVGSKSTSPEIQPATVARRAGSSATSTRTAGIHPYSEIVARGDAAAHSLAHSEQDATFSMSLQIETALGWPIAGINYATPVLP